MQEVKEYLLSKEDLKYKEFSNGLNICNKYKSIGVRLPILRDYAKKLFKKYELSYLINNIDDEYYEEIMLKGFIIGNYQNLTYDELIYYIDLHINKILDWSMCDTFVSSLKITKKYQDKLWNYLIKNLKSKKEFIVRFSLVMFLNYYINDTYQEKLYDVIKKVNFDSYYVKMANAWLLSYMFVKYFDDTIKFVKETNLDSWTVVKGITKAIESRRISEKQKDILRELRNIVKEKD